MTLLRRRPQKKPPEPPQGGGLAPVDGTHPLGVCSRAPAEESIPTAPAPSRDARHRELERVLGLPAGYVDARLAQQEQERQLEIEKQQHRMEARERAVMQHMKRTLEAYLIKQNAKER